ncbi:MAG: hypothetical protein GY793_09300 [Proteobacteria bacterium]|nr:hypothetical protein [Pseudomonadota bacterium]
MMGEETREKLELAFNYLDYIWKVGEHESDEYMEAHNAYIEAYKRFPGVRLNEYSIRKLKDANIPGEILTILRPLKSRMFTDQGTLWAEIERNIDKNKIAVYKKLILEQARHIFYPYSMKEECSVRYVKFDHDNNKLVYKPKFPELISEPDQKKLTNHITKSIETSKKILTDYFITKFPKNAEKIKDDLDPSS